jgi:1-acyl-sn-glycerol-3-phosphate acyltransferase
MTLEAAGMERSHLRAVLRITGLFLWVVGLAVPAFFLWLLRLEKLRGRVVWLVYRGACVICGIRLTREGGISATRPFMLISNHTSYLDIFILGSFLPVSFTPKREIRSWPLIGFLAVLADCVFVERKPTDMQRARAEMEKKLKAGKVLALFPEGTTGDGYHVLPFKTGFFNLVEEHDLPLQAVSLAYTHIGATPLSAATRELVAWIGDATLVGHTLRLLSFPYIQVTAKFYPVERIGNYEDRKALAKSCEATIAGGLKASLEANGVTG